MNETVWAVWSLDWEDQDVLSVWGSSELAEQELERLKALDHEWYGAQLAIREHALNEPWEPV